MAVASHADEPRDAPSVPSSFAPTAQSHAVDVGAPVLTRRMQDPTYPQGAPAVSTWDRGHRLPEFRDRRYGGGFSGFSTSAYDANSVAVHNPRSWGQPSESSPGTHEQPPDPSLRRFDQTQEHPQAEQYDFPTPASPHSPSAPAPSPAVPQHNYNTAAEREPVHQFYGNPTEQRPSLLDASSSENTSSRSRDQSRPVSPAHHAHDLPPIAEDRRMPIRDDRQVPSAFHGPIAPSTQPQRLPADVGECVDHGFMAAPRQHHSYAHPPGAGVSGHQALRVQEEPEHRSDTRGARGVSHDHAPPTAEFNPPRHSTPHHPLPPKPSQLQPHAPGGAGDDNGWAPKPSVELTDGAAAWDSPNIQVWASNVNDTQQVPAAAVLSTEVADDVDSLPERPDSAKPMRKPVTVFISPEPSPGPVGATSAREDSTAAPRVELGGGAPENIDASHKPLNDEGGDDFDRPRTPSDDSDNLDHSKHDEQQELGPDFWKESTHPRDCPRFQSRRVFVV